MKASEFTFDSCVSGVKIYTRLFEPDAAPKAVLQICHGMAEHGALYKPFCEFMAGQGFAVAVNDHVGHGRSVHSGALYGHFGDEGGLQNTVRDARQLQTLLRRRFPNVPYFLMGHSMGSFIARAFTAQFGESLTAAVFMGTSAGLPTALWKAERVYLKLLKKTKGPGAKLSHLERLATGPYNRTVKNPRTASDWVTSKEEEVDRFVADPLCGFPLTVQGYIDLGTLLQEINSDAWFKAVPTALPILLISGEDDPVGDMGRGVRAVQKRLLDTGHSVTLTLYPGIRHALVTERNSDEVFRDIEAFLTAHLQ